MTPGDARCPNHPDVPALGNCQRCGTFFCAEDRLDVDGVAYCRPCGERPDVDWIEAYRRSLLGRRDGWAWLFGSSAVGWLIIAVSVAVNAEGRGRLLAIPAAASALAGAVFFLGRPVARTLLILCAGFWCTLGFALVGPWNLAPTVMTVIFVSTALTNTRTRLFFRLEVSRRDVAKDYERLADNPLARSSFALGVASLLLPVVGPLAVVLGAVAFQRVDPTAKPPVGKRGRAIAGIVFGGLGSLVGAVWLWLALAARR